MDLESFHDRLFGDNASTPEWARLNDTHKKLYQGFLEGKHGFRASAPGEENFDQFLAVVVTALHQTTFPSREEAYLIVTPAVQKWCVAQLKGIVRKMIQARRKSPRSQTQPLIEAIQRLLMGDRPIQMTGVPNRWVSYGFTHDDTPSWFRGTLID